MAGQFPRKQILRWRLVCRSLLGGTLRINSPEDMKGDWMERNQAVTKTTAEASADPRARVSSFIEARGSFVPFYLSPSMWAALRKTV